MDKKNQIKLINEAYRKIDDVLSIQHMGEYGKQYYNLNKGEELQHDKFRPSDVKRGLTISEAVKLFYVTQIIQALKGTLKVTVKEYLFVRKSIFFAVALVETYKIELTEALKGINYDDILAVDYAELNK